MIQIFGDFDENLPASDECLVIGFSPTCLPLKQRWRHSGLSADFMADYLITFFPASEDDPKTTQRQMEMKGAVSYIANELLENAMKYNDETSPYPVRVGLHLRCDRVACMSTNSIHPKQVAKFQTFIEKLMTSDPEELYIRQLEENAGETYSDASMLGYLTMINDYLAKVGWKFETLPHDPNVVIVTSMVQIVV